MHGTHEAGVEARLPLLGVDRTIVLCHGRRRTGPYKDVRRGAGREDARAPFSLRMICYHWHDVDGGCVRDFFCRGAQARFGSRRNNQIHALTCQRESCRLADTCAAAIDDGLAATNAQIHRRPLRLLQSNAITGVNRIDESVITCFYWESR